MITNGFPNAGMPAFKFDPAELTGLVAYLRNMNTFDRGSMKPGDAARGQVVFEGKGACLSCHRVTQGQPQGARPERHRRDPQRGHRSSARCAIRTGR